MNDKKQKNPADPVKKWTRILLLVALALFIWFLLADRFTPISSQGKVNAYVVPIAPEVSGAIVRVEAEDNSLVSEGQQLLKVDPTVYELAVNAAEAQYQTALQSVDAGSSNVASARASVEAARALVLKAQQDVDRMKRIQKEDAGAISERRVESSEATLASAKSSLLAAEAGVEAAVAALGETDESNSALQQARAAVEQARLNLERTSVLAPSDGLITDLRVDVGNFAAAGHPLMTFIALNETWVQAYFTENNLGHISVGDRVLLVFDVQPGKIYKGTVRQLGYGVAVQSNPLGTLPTIENQRTFLREAQRFPVIIDFDEKPGDIGLRVGSQVTAAIFTGTHPVMNTLVRIYMRLYSIMSYLY